MGLVKYLSRPGTVGPCLFQMQLMSKESSFVATVSFQLMKLPGPSVSEATLLTTARIGFMEGSGFCCAKDGATKIKANPDSAVATIRRRAVGCMGDMLLRRAGACPD